MQGAHQSHFAIATITWAANQAEESWLRRSLAELAKLDRPVYITDGGSPDSFVAFLKTFPHFHIQAGIKGVWPQAKQSLQNAVDAGHEYILYTEPDKHDFFSYLHSFCPKGKYSNDSSSITIFSRSAAGFASFPLFQQMTETTINKCCEELIGQAADYTYGPFILNQRIVNNLHSLPGDIGWGWRPFAFNIARRLGFNTRHVEYDFFCPPDQQQDSPSERIHRMNQLHQNILGLTLSESASLNDIGSK